MNRRVANFLERRGLLKSDEDNSYFMLDELSEYPMQALHSHSVIYHIAMAPKLAQQPSGANTPA